LDKFLKRYKADLVREMGGGLSGAVDESGRGLVHVPPVESSGVVVLEGLSKDLLSS
jgi:hypothetical protein